MRIIIRDFRQCRFIPRHVGEKQAIYLVSSSRINLVKTRLIYSTCQALKNYAQTIRYECRLSSMISRGLSVDGLKTSMLPSVAFYSHFSDCIGDRGPLVEYRRRIDAGELMDGDLCQLGTVTELQMLYDELVEKADECRLDRFAASKWTDRSSLFWSRFMSHSSYSPVKGLYLYGGVGTGKTMLMDLFFHQLPRFWRKKRIHFHDFMLNVHNSLQQYKGVSNPLELVAEEISKDVVLLCLDEFMVTDVAVALILNRLFGHLFRNGVVLVATSNRAPDNLYERGLQRDLFLPFVTVVKDRCVVREINSLVDYRTKNSGDQGYYLIGLDLSNVLKDKFQQLIGRHTPQSQEVDVIMGRTLQVPLAANGCAYFTFEELCDRPVGAADYFGLFKKFHTLVLEGIPVFGLHNKTSAYRFVTLVDVMYDAKARLLCTAEGNPIELFERISTISDAKQIEQSKKRKDLDLCVDNRLAFSKVRTISRLMEMNSKQYQEQGATGNVM